MGFQIEGRTKNEKMQMRRGLNSAKRPADTEIKRREIRGQILGIRAGRLQMRRSDGL